MQKTGSLLSNNRRFLPLLTTIGLFVIVYALGALSLTGMRDPQVFFNLFRNSPFLLISAVGSTFVILAGGIDLSVSGIIALTTVASAQLLREGWNPWAVMLLMLAMGMAFGVVMGGFITYLKVQPFIVTLAGMWFARGMCFFINDDAVRITDRVYRILGQTKILIDLLVSEDYKAFLRELIEEKQRGGPVLGSLAYLRTLLDFYPYACYPTLVPRVLPNGDLSYPCRPIEKDHNGHGGRPSNLLQVRDWNQAIAQAVAAYGRPPLLCASCYQQCFAEPSLMQARPFDWLAEWLRFPASRSGSLTTFAPG